MTKQQLSENTPVIVRAGIVIAMVGSLFVWFHNRLDSVEKVQIEQKTDLKYIKEAVDDIKRAVQK